MSHLVFLIPRTGNKRLKPDWLIIQCTDTRFFNPGNINIVCDQYVVYLYFVVVFRAPEPPFEVLEVSTTPMSISSPAQPPPTTAEESNRDKPRETSIMQVCMGCRTGQYSEHSLYMLNCDLTWQALYSLWSLSYNRAKI